MLAKIFLQKCLPLTGLTVYITSFCSCDKLIEVPTGREIVNATIYEVRLDFGPGQYEYSISPSDTLFLTGICEDGPGGRCEVGYGSPIVSYIYFDESYVLIEEGSVTNRWLGADPSANFPGWEFVGDRDGDGRTWFRYVIGDEDFDNAEPL